MDLRKAYCNLHASEIYTRSAQSSQLHRRQCNMYTKFRTMNRSSQSADTADHATHKTTFHTQSSKRLCPNTRHYPSPSHHKKASDLNTTTLNPTPFAPYAPTPSQKTLTETTLPSRNLELNITIQTQTRRQAHRTAPPTPTPIIAQRSQRPAAPRTMFALAIGRS